MGQPVPKREWHQESIVLGKVKGYSREKEGTVRTCQQAGSSGKILLGFLCSALKVKGSFLLTIWKATL